MGTGQQTRRRAWQAGVRDGGRPPERGHTASGITGQDGASTDASEQGTPTLDAASRGSVQDAGAREDPGARDGAAPQRPSTEPGASRWWVPRVDDLSSANYCDKKGATPDKVDGILADARTHLDTLKNDSPDVYQRYKKTMSDEDMVMVAVYSSQAAYAMNAVLRGQLKSDPWVRAYGSLARGATAALAKAPKGISNKLHAVQGTNLVDDRKSAKKVIPIPRAYRVDSWSGFFDPVFAAEYKVGKTLHERGFLSTTVSEGAYAGAEPVKKTIEGAKVARAIGDLSQISTENEVLFSPGASFQVVSIELETEGRRIQVPDPTAILPNADKGDRAFNAEGKVWHVKLKHVGAAEAKESASPDNRGATKPNRDTRPKAKRPSALERLLGVANTLD